MECSTPRGTLSDMATLEVRGSDRVGEFLVYAAEAIRVGDIIGFEFVMTTDGIARASIVFADQTSSRAPTKKTETEGE